MVPLSFLCGAGRSVPDAHALARLAGELDTTLGALLFTLAAALAAGVGLWLTRKK